jgi:hypothetical protein
MDRPEGELVRFSPVERRLLADLAAAQGVTVETVIREALTLLPYATPEKRRRHLSVVRLRDVPHTSRLRL